jgi:23S rRNA (adenine2503-C2)-methyltransferase
MDISEIHCLSTQTSADGSVKFLWQFPDRTTVESIYFTFPHEGQERPFVCLSSQDGCNVGCTFCATGQQRMRRNLTAPEMLAQVVKGMEVIHTNGGPATAFHIAFAGMGEPLLNYEQVITAAAALRSAHLADVVSVSTSGVVPQIRDLALVAATSVNRLYISLHATTDEQRTPLIPLNRKYPLTQVLRAARSYAEQTGTKVTATYLLFAGLNDTPDDLERLMRLLDPDRFLIQLSVWNTIEGMHFAPSPHIEVWQQRLSDRGYETILQRSKGRDIAGGCGQLRGRLLPML